MNIAYATDENYAVHAYISLNSLLETNKEEKEITVYIVANGMTDKTCLHFSRLIDKYNSSNTRRTIEFIPFAPFGKQIEKAYDMTEKWNYSTYGRLFLATIPRVDTILFIDCDTVVLGPLHELFEMPLNNVAVAGVQDVESLKTRKAVGLAYGDRYFNAGVSLLNLKYWRDNNSIEQCIEYIKHYGGKVPFEDQGVMNAVFKNNKIILHPKFNVMNVMLIYNAPQISTFYDVENYYNETEIEKAINDVRIVHYTAGAYTRPWYSNSNHPYAHVEVQRNFSLEFSPAA